MKFFTEADEGGSSSTYTCRLDGVEFGFKTYSDAHIEVLSARPITADLSNDEY